MSLEELGAVLRAKRFKGQADALSAVLTVAEAAGQVEAFACRLEEAWMGERVCVATPHRIIVLAAHGGEVFVSDYPLTRVGTVEVRSGFHTDEVLVHLIGGQLVRLTHARPITGGFAEFVNSRLAGLGEEPSKPADSDAQMEMLKKLELLGQLRDRGVLTDSEFDEQKRRMLN